jgi:hypothetical protein
MDELVDAGVLVLGGPLDDVRLPTRSRLSPTVEMPAPRWDLSELLLALDDPPKANEAMRKAAHRAQQRVEQR